MLKPISDRYHPDRIPVGPIAVQYRFRHNANLEGTFSYVAANFFELRANKVKCLSYHHMRNSIKVSKSTRVHIT